MIKQLSQECEKYNTGKIQLNDFNNSINHLIFDNVKTQLLSSQIDFFEKQFEIMIEEYIFNFIKSENDKNFIRNSFKSKILSFRGEQII